MLKAQIASGREGFLGFHAVSYCKSRSTKALEHESCDHSYPFPCRAPPASIFPPTQVQLLETAGCFADSRTDRVMTNMLTSENMTAAVRRRTRTRGVRVIRSTAFRAYPNLDAAGSCFKETATPAFEPPAAWTALHVFLLVKDTNDVYTAAFECCVH